MEAVIKSKKAKNTPQACQTDWRRGQTKYNPEDELGTPYPEGKLRRRVCRVCALPVEAKSYWYCHAHNVLTSESEDNEYSCNIFTDNYE